MINPSVWHVRSAMKIAYPSIVMYASTYALLSRRIFFLLALIGRRAPGQLVQGAQCIWHITRFILCVSACTCLLWTCSVHELCRATPMLEDRYCMGTSLLCTIGCASMAIFEHYILSMLMIQRRVADPGR